MGPITRLYGLWVPKATSGYMATMVTRAPLSYAGGGTNELMTGTRKWNTGIVARGSIYVANDNKVYAFRVPGGGTPTPTPTATATANTHYTTLQQLHATATATPTATVTPTATPVRRLVQRPVPSQPVTALSLPN